MNMWVGLQHNICCMGYHFAGSWVYVWFGFWVFVEVKTESSLMEFGVQFEVVIAIHGIAWANALEHQRGYRICRVYPIFG